MAQKITLEVTRKEQVTEKVYFVTFRLIDPPSIAFKAGQNMMLMVAPGINRTMSIASPPSQTSELLMVHDVSPMGPGSKWTLGLNVGDKATVVAPTGGVLSFLDTPRRKVMIATGTGIAPFRPTVLDYLEHGGKAPMAIYWGQRFEHDIYWKEELDAIAAGNPAFVWHQVLSRPTDAWTGLRGHVTEHVLTMETALPESEFYLCGNKGMIEEVRTALLERNVPKEQIKSELFY